MSVNLRKYIGKVSDGEAGFEPSPQWGRATGKQKHTRNRVCFVAERAGFEPATGF